MSGIQSKFLWIFRVAIFFSLVMTGVIAAQDRPELKFQGFDGTFLKLGEYSVGFYDFELSVDYEPFHFVYKGRVNAGPSTLDLPYLLEDVVAVVGYWDDPYSKASDGKPKQFSIDNLRMYLDDEKLNVKEEKVELLPPWDNNAEAKALLKKSDDHRASYEKETTEEERESYLEDALIVASADPWNVEFREMMLQARKDSIAKHKADSLAAIQRAEQRRLDSLAALKAAKEKRAREIAAAKAAEEKRKRELEEAKKRQAEQAKRQATLRKQQEEQDKRVVRKRVVRKEVQQTPEEAPKRRVVKRVVKKPVEEEPPPRRKVVRKVRKPADPGWTENDELDREAKTKKNYKNYAYGAFAVGGVSLIYSLMEMQKMNDAQTAYNNNLAAAANATAVNDVNTALLYQAEATKKLEEKNNHEGNRNLGLLLGAVCIGGGIVLYRF